MTEIDDLKMQLQRAYDERLDVLCRMSKVEARMRRFECAHHTIRDEVVSALQQSTAGMSQEAAQRIWKALNEAVSEGW